MSQPEPPFNDPPTRSGEMDLAKVHGSILREHREPVEGYKSVPLWLVALIMALVFWGGGYLAFYSGGFRADAFLPRKGMTGIAAADPAQLGRRIYMQSCALCHQADGRGIPRIYPPLAGSDWVLAKDWRGDSHLASIVLHGLIGPLEVQGVTYNGAMPGWHGLGDKEIAAVLTYIRSQWGNDAPPITADFVKTVRAKNPDRVTAWTPAELQSAVARENSPPPAASPLPDSSP
jgi:mono/diheme cytochrome c family protein